MDSNTLLQNQTRDSISTQDKGTQKKRSFHLQVNQDKHGMIQHDIQGWMHIDEAKILWDTIQHYDRCLELGTYQGLSTWIIAQANPNCKITTVEIFEDNTTKAKQNCCDFSNIDFVTADSNEWLRDCGKKFDWVFVDHSHESFYMDQTLMLLRQCVTQDHLILLHDMHLPGVQSQAYKFATFTRIRNLGIGRLW